MFIASFLLPDIMVKPGCVNFVSLYGKIIALSRAHCKHDDTGGPFVHGAEKGVSAPPLASPFGGGGTQSVTERVFLLGYKSIAGLSALSKRSKASNPITNDRNGHHEV